MRAEQDFKDFSTNLFFFIFLLVVMFFFFAACPPKFDSPDDADRAKQVVNVTIENILD